MMGRYAEIVNSSRNQIKIKKLVEHKFPFMSNVEVWWEPLSQPNEMCGYSGGFFACSDQMEMEPIGSTTKEAMDYISVLEWWFD